MSSTKTTIFFAAPTLEWIIKVSFTMYAKVIIIIGSTTSDLIQISHGPSDDSSLDNTLSTFRNTFFATDENNILIIVKSNNFILSCRENIMIITKNINVLC